jgi:ATP-dependent helicase/nuclease subunit A
MSNSVEDARMHVADNRPPVPLTGRDGGGDDPNVLQRMASDPMASVWVSASAGAGKTKVLSDRVLRQMLSGTEPHRILCLTFTKAAAAEMANRVNERLGRWATMDDADLQRD